MRALRRVLRASASSGSGASVAIWPCRRAFSAAFSLALLARALGASLAVSFALAMNTIHRILENHKLYHNLAAICLGGQEAYVGLLLLGAQTGNPVLLGLGLYFVEGLFFAGRPDFFQG